MARFEVEDATLVVRRRWLIAALAGWSIACIPIAIILGSNGMPWAILPLMVVTLALGLAIRRWPYRWSGKASVDGDLVKLDGRVIATRADITNAISSTRDGRAVVRLSRGWAGIDVDVELEREADAKALLARLRLDRAHRTSRLVASLGTPREAARSSAFSSVVLAVLGALPVVLLGAVGLVSTAFAVVAAFVLAWRSFVTLTVGADGVLVQRSLAKERFVPYADIEEVRSREGILEIVTKGGRAPLRLHLSGLGLRLDRAVYGDEHDFRLRAFTERVSEAIRDRSNAPPFAPERLARGGRSVSRWVRDLRGVDEETAGFRDNAVPSDVLLGIVENPAALPTARAGAAVALGARLDQGRPAAEPELRARLRVAAEACASPALRVALTTAAEAEDAESRQDRLADALAGLDDDPREPALAARLRSQPIR